MSKGNSTALKVSAIISFVVAGLIILLALCVLFNWFNAEAYYNEAVKYMYGDTPFALGNTYKYMIFLESVFTGAMNIYAGSVYLKVAKSKHYVLVYGKLLTYVSILQIILTSNALSGIISLIVSLNLKDIKKKEQKIGVEKYNDTATKVAYIKQLLENNKITQQQYDEMFNKILEEEALKNIK